MQARYSLNMSGAVYTALLCALLSPFPVWSDPPLPETIPGATLLSAEALVALAGREPRLVMIDARIEGDRAQGYIEGSVSLPDTQTNCQTLAQRLSGPDQPVMFYCNGVNCRRSYNAVRQALQCGYAQVYWMRGGFAEWKAKGYPYLNE